MDIDSNWLNVDKARTHKIPSKNKKIMRNNKEIKLRTIITNKDKVDKTTYKRMRTINERENMFP